MGATRSSKQLAREIFRRLIRQRPVRNRSVIRLLTVENGSRPVYGVLVDLVEPTRNHDGTVTLSDTDGPSTGHMRFPLGEIAEIKVVNIFHLAKRANQAQSVARLLSEFNDRVAFLLK